MHIYEILDELNEHESQPQSCLRMDRVLTGAVRALAKELLAKELLDLNQENANLIARLEFLESRNNILTSQVDFLMNMQSSNAK